MFLSEYNLTVNYLPGKSNVFADGLSRIKLRLVAALGQVDDWMIRIQKAIDADPDSSAIR